MQIQFDIKNLRQHRGKMIGLGIAALVELFLCFCHYRLSGQVTILPACLLGLALFACVEIRIEKKLPALLVQAAIALAMSLIYLYYARKLQDVVLPRLGNVRTVLNLLVYFSGLAIVYILSGNFKISHIVNFTFWVFVEVLNRMISLFRFLEISPADLLSLRTAMNVAGSYKPTFTPAMVETAIVYVLVISCLLFVLKIQELKKLRLVALVLLVLSCGVIYKGLDRVTAYHYGPKGTHNNGFPVNFLKSIFELHVTAPEGYSPQRLRELEEQYGTPPEQEAHYPNIIVIMNESFSDLRVIGDDIYTDEDVLTHYEALNEDVIKGYALASVYGGNTANSEWEFLTGHSMAFLPPDVVPFQNYVWESGNDSLVSRLHELDYHCIAMHPYRGSGWSRTTVYPRLGIDEFYFRSSFPKEDIVREYIADRELYRELFKKFEEKPDGQRLFFFGVTMQNHGNYNYEGDNFTNTVVMRPPFSEEYIASQYLSLIKISDESIDMLLDYFRNVDEDTIIVFFGDHQPNMDVDYLEAIHGSGFDTLAEQQLKYTVPFFIWANYDIEEKEVRCSSINYLSNYIYRISGLPTTGYDRFLMDLEETIPAINAFGYYSPEKGDFIPFGDAEGKEAQMIRDYNILEYNSVFDTKNKSSLFSH